MKAALINWYRRNVHRHPAAIARRVERERAKAAAKPRQEQERARRMEVAEQLRREMGMAS